MDSMGEDPPVILPTGAGRKSSCRPLPDPGVTMRHIPGPHHGATADRRRAGPVIPAVRDTTTINHSHLRATEGLPEIGGEPLHWPRLTTERPAEGEAGAAFAATVLDRYGGRRAMETWFRTPGPGRGLGPAGSMPPMT